MKFLTPYQHSCGVYYKGLVQIYYCSSDNNNILELKNNRFSWILDWISIILTLKYYGERKTESIFFQEDICARPTKVMEPDIENNCELFIAEREKKLQSIENLRLKEQLWLVKNTGLKKVFFRPYMSI